MTRLGKANLVLQLEKQLLGVNAGKNATRISAGCCYKR